MKLDLSLTYEPKRIISIVGPSRSGSSIMKHALCLHPDLTSLAGEEEPYYKLAKNGWPWHMSDKFNECRNPELVRACIANEVHGYYAQQNRQWLQQYEIEEPPYVCAKASTHVTDTLVLKTPQNCYRRHVLEKLYPTTHFTYIVTTRSKPAVINGLLDGWESQNFKARRVLDWGRYDNWWRFDMPLDWRCVMHASVETICRYQHDMAVEFCDTDYDCALRWNYEEFCVGWRTSVCAMWRMLGLEPIDVSKVELPVLMATETPGVERWREKRPWLEKYL